MNHLARFKVSHRLVLLTLLALLGIAVIIGEALWSSDTQLREDRRVKTRHLVEVAHGIIAGWQSLEAKGELTKEQAQARAIAQLKGLRYEKNEYFWVNDMHPTMVMHPIKPALDGSDLSDFKDPNGTRLFVKAVEVVQKSGTGFVSYMWPKPGHDKPVSKISYVSGFSPWGWVIGSGIYVDDVDRLFWGNAMRSLLIAAGLAIALMVAAWGIGGSITRQLGGEPGYANEIARRVAAGDLTGQVQLKSGDQTSVLYAMSVMQSNLTKIIREIQQGAGDIASAVRRVAADSNNIRVASESQSAAATSTASAVNQITASIGQVSDSANETESESVQTAALSKSGESLAKQASEGIAAVAKTVDIATQQIQSLKGRLAEIDSFSMVIKEIADQTNLLALNAAIEAARAGEQGRGFAVVADEVRKLAERTTRSTEEIRQVVATIQDGSERAVVGMERAVAAVKSGETLAAQAGESTNEITSRADSMVNEVSSISAALKEQGAASNEIATRVENIVRMSEENSVSAQSSSKAAQQLRELAQEMIGQVGRFRV